MRCYLRKVLNCWYTETMKFRYVWSVVADFTARGIIRKIRIWSYVGTGSTWWEGSLPPGRYELCLPFAQRRAPRSLDVVTDTETLRCSLEQNLPDMKLESIRLEPEEIEVAEGQEATIRAVLGLSAQPLDIETEAFGVLGDLFIEDMWGHWHAYHKKIWLDLKNPAMKLKLPGPRQLGKKADYVKYKVWLGDLTDIGRRRYIAIRRVG